MNLDILKQAQCFVYVARHKSFAAAAEELQMSSQEVSKSIAGLEEHFGKRLIVRDTRFRGLTAFGSRYLSETEPLLIKLGAVIEFLREMPSQPWETMLAEPPDADDTASQPL